MAPLALPEGAELFVDTGPPTDTQSFGLGSPTSARQIRDRPIDIDKEIPLLFVDDDASGGLTPTADGMGAPSVLPGALPIPASRQNSGGLVSALTCSGSPYGGFQCVSGSVLPQDINIPQYVASMHWEPPAVARRFRLPAKFLTYRPGANGDRVAEYELDSEDLAWLAELNRGQRQPLLDEDKMEEAMDALEKASFKALHGHLQSQRAMIPSGQPPMANGGLSPKVGAASPRPPAHGGSGNGRRKEAKRSGGALPSPQRSPKQPKQPKPDRPPPPSDSELINLPAGLCRRYQQGRCHKGRSCKWKHEVWPELQLRWEQWQNGPGGGGNNGNSSTSGNGFASTTASAGATGSQFKSLDLLPKEEEDPLGEMALSELGVASALDLVPPSLVPPGMKEREAAKRQNSANNHHALLLPDTLGLSGLGASLSPAAAAPASLGAFGADDGVDAMLDDSMVNAVLPPAAADDIVGSAFASEEAEAAEAAISSTSSHGMEPSKWSTAEPATHLPATSEAANGETTGDDVVLEAEGGAEGASAPDLGADVDALDDFKLGMDAGTDAAAAFSEDAKYDAVDDEPSAPTVGAAGGVAADAPMTDAEGVDVLGSANGDAINGLCAETAPLDAMYTEGGDNALLLDSAAGNAANGTAEGTTMAPSPISSDYGVPRSALRELLKGILTRVQLQLYDYWLEKRRKDPEQLPLLSRLRQEAAQMRARHAQLSTAHTDVVELRVHLHRMRRLLGLVRKRERLKAQIAALHQAHFETCVKQRRASAAASAGASSRDVPPPMGPPSSPEKRMPKLEDLDADSFLPNGDMAGMLSLGDPLGSVTGQRRSGRQTKDKERFDEL